MVAGAWRGIARRVAGRFGLIGRSLEMREARHRATCKAGESDLESILPVPCVLRAAHHPHPP